MQPQFVWESRRPCFQCVSGECQAGGDISIASTGAGRRLGLVVHPPAQLRAARALLGIDQRTLAELAGVSLPTIQRMEAATDDYVRGVVDSLTKVVEALEREGVS